MKQLTTYDGATTHNKGKYGNNGKGWYFRFDAASELQIYNLDHLNLNVSVEHIKPNIR